MSLSSIDQAAHDDDLAARTNAAAHKEAQANPTFGDTDYGRAVMAGRVTPWEFYSYVITVTTEAAYESALVAGNPAPGADPSVITDGDISTAVQVHWPDDEEPAP